MSKSEKLIKTDTKEFNRRTLTTKLTLVLVLIIGLALILGGVVGIRDFGTSGFNSEEAYSDIYTLGKSSDAFYSKYILPVVDDALSDQQQKDLDQIINTLLISQWEIDEQQGIQNLEELIAKSENPRKLQYELLTLSYSLSGPKVSSATKKNLAALEDRDQFRKGILKSLTDDAVTLPEFAQELIADSTELEKQSTLMQLFLVGARENGETVSANAVNNIKKSVRDSNIRLKAFEKIVQKDMSYFKQLLFTNSRSAILLGIFVVINCLLLAFMLGHDGSWRIDFKWLIIILIIDFMLLFQLMPIGFLVIRSLFPEGSFTFEIFRRLYSYSMNWSALKNTFIASFATMVFGTVIAFPLAWLIGRTDLYGKKFFRGLFVLTYMVPPYLGAMAWLRLLNPNVGNINVVLRTIFGLKDSVGPINIYSLGGLIWVLTSFYYPYAFITISRAMEKMDPSLEEASRISGASPVKTVLKITLPMMTPSLIAGALLVFVSAASSYGIPSIIGTPGKIHTVTTRIIEYYGIGPQGLNDATGLAVFLMALAAIILYFTDFFMAKRQYITVSGKSTRPNIVELGKWRTPLTIVVTVFASIMILLPFLTILITSFKIDVGKGIFEAGNFTIRQWTLIFSRGETLESLKNSLIFASITATVGIVVSYAMSYLLQRTRLVGRKIPDFLITLGSGTPSVVIALGLIMTMKGNYGINIYNTAYIMIVAYLIKYLLMGMRTVVSAMSQIHVSLEESSQVSGASWLHTMIKITGPLIFPSVAAGWFLIFIPSFYELAMTTLLYTNNTKTIGFQLYEYWTFTSQPQASAMAFGILLIVIALNALLHRLTKGEFSI